MFYGYATKETKEKISQSMKDKFSGEKNPMWKGGNGDYWAREAKKRLEKQGIDLTGLIVHHKDGNCKNNNLENLQAMTASEHGKLHNPKGKKFGA